MEEQYTRREFLRNTGMTLGALGLSAIISETPAEEKEAPTKPKRVYRSGVVRIKQLHGVTTDQYAGTRPYIPPSASLNAF